MSLPAFDTLKYTKSLEESGINRKEAEAHAKAQMESLSALMEEKLVTKEDLVSVKTELKLDMKDMKISLIKWMIGLMSGWSAILISIMATLKFFP